MLSRFVIWGKPQTPYGASRGQQINFQVQKLSNPYDPPTPVPLQHCRVLSGVFSRAFFFLCPFCFFCFSRVRSFPSRGRSGVVAWLLFVVVAFVVSFVLWLGCVVRFRLAFSCCCLCVGCLVVGRFRGVCASWLVFCRWVCLVCLRACCALSCFCWGLVPLFSPKTQAIAIIKFYRFILG